MIRYVHHQLMGVAMAVCACVVGAPVAFGVRGIPAVVDDAVWMVVVISMLGGVLFGMLEASRLKWVSVVRTFEEAVPLDDPEPPDPPTTPCATTSSTRVSSPCCWWRHWSRD